MDIFDTNVLVGVVPNLLLSQNWLLDRFFGNIVEADSEEVSIDVDIGKRRMSPFVSPLVEGKLVEQRKFQTNTFKPAYIKDKRAPDLRKPIRRQIGERIGGNLTGEARAMFNLQEEMADQIDMLNRRLEWMASQALQYGKVTIIGDGIPSPVVVDFGRDASLTTSIMGTASDWMTGASATPGDDIDNLATQIMGLSGAAVTDIIFTPTAFAGFKKDASVRDAIVLDTNRFNRNNQTASVNLGAQIPKGAIYKGNWGQFDLWVYNDWYVDENDVQRRMIPDGKVVLCGPDLMGTRAFGQIVDPAFNYAPMAFAPKSWLNEDPAQRFIMMQSSPIVIPSRVNAAACMTVTGPAVAGNEA